MTLYTHDITYEKNSPFLYDSYATTLADNGNLVEAEKAYNLSLTLEPNQPNAYGGLGAIAATRGNFPLAKKYLLVALSRNPGVSVYQNYALVLFYTEKSKQKEETLKFVLSALRIFPNNEVLNRIVAQIYEDQGRMLDAQPYIQKLPQNNSLPMPSQ
jgi:tetratricopeptide (TPR) repeat protein